MNQYRVNLDFFAGPLDLLLYLVRKDEVDIYDIPIAEITAEYVRHVEMIKMFDIDLAGDFLVMAATLMEIKSAMLLPRAEVDEDGGPEDISDPRFELVRQLLEYKKFKDAANLLNDSAEERSQRFARPDSIITNLEPDAEPELDLEQISIWTLLEAFDEIMQATGRLHSYDHIQDDTPIDLYQIEILHRLQTEGNMTFQQLFQGRDNRMVLVGLFLATLELIRDHLIWVEQPAQPGLIYLRSLTDEPAEEAVRKAIYATSVENENAKEDRTDRQTEPQPEELDEDLSDVEAQFDLSALNETQPADEPAPVPDQTAAIPLEPAKTPPIPIRQLPPLKTTNQPEPVTNDSLSQQPD
jgi:segregation and condensation protein A